MSGLDVAAGAIGVASLGIQVCQGLLSYYNDWKDYKSDVGSAYDAIADLAKTLALLKESLEIKGLNKERTDRVKTCLASCENSLIELSKKLQNIRRYRTPERRRQKMIFEMQRLLYPFHKETLCELHNNVDNIRGCLTVAVQVLQLDVSIATELSVAEVVLQQQSHIAVQQSGQLKKIIHWLSAPDPWTNHASARQRHEAETGSWLLQSGAYRGWQTGTTKHIWMYGKAGCGKTILCSTVVEDIREHWSSTTNTGLAIFYFSFSDDQKQTYETLMRSLIAQLGWREPGLTILRQAYDKPNRSVPGVDELERIFHSSIQSYDRVFLVLDALDESPEEGDIRQNMLDRLVSLAHNAQSVSVFLTSRETRDVREAMEVMDVTEIDVSVNSVDTDIRRYVSSEVSRDPRLRRLKPESRTMIEETLSHKADGMFRWVYCQLQELKKLKSTKPKYIIEALHMLPKTLDDTYTRMLSNIAPMYHKEALTLLRWLAYAREPLTLAELAEAAIIDPSAEDSVDIENRGHVDDTLGILSGLVTIINHGDVNQVTHDSVTFVPDNEDENMDDVASYDQRTSPDTRIRLAHFSVKEFLESDRVPATTNHFRLQSSTGHRFLAQSCLKYLIHYSHSSKKYSCRRDLEAFPLLKVAAKTWYFHSALQQCGEASLEATFLSSEKDLRQWLLIHQPDRSWEKEFSPLSEVASGLYYASYTGLSGAVSLLLETGAGVNAQGGDYGNALQAASQGNHAEVVKILLDGGAEVNSQGGDYGSALHAASLRGHIEVVRLLLGKGADINTRAGHYCNAFHTALLEGHIAIARLLLENGADVNAQGGDGSSALYTASFEGHTEVVQLLLANAADVNAQGGYYGHALQAASVRGHMDAVQLLLENGANVNAYGGYYGTALQAALHEGHMEVVELLLEKCADDDGV